MNILLADDERLTRLGLKSMIEELYPEQHNFDEVSDGEMLLEYVEKAKPDLIFLDIHMPRLTGLQAYSQFQDMQIPVIMLTGYAEFEYAREALKLGALDYLLKPASLEEVRITMEKALSLHQRQNEIMERDYELEYAKLLDLYTTIGFLQKPKYVLPPYTCILFYFDGYRRETFKQDLDQLHQALKESCGNQTPSAMTFMPTGEICFLTSTAIPAPSFRTVLDSFHEGRHLRATGFYLYSEDLADLLPRLEDVQKEESLRFCRGFGSILTDSDRKQSAAFLPFSTLLEKLLLAHRGGDLIRFQKELSNLEQFLSSSPFLPDSPSLNQILSIEAGVSVSVHTPAQLIGFLKSMSSSHQSMDLADRIDLYIEQHYMEQIGISIIADKLNISPNYLSKIYKMKTGKNFTDHLTDVRIRKARDLMDSGRISSVRETAGQVGYFSTRYFTKVFLKNTGMLPSEYLKNALLAHTER